MSGALNERAADDLLGLQFLVGQLAHLALHLSNTSLKPLLALILGEMTDVLEALGFVGTESRCHNKKGY